MSNVKNGQHPLERILARKYAYLATFLAVFFVSLVFLQAANIAPDELSRAREEERPALIQEEPVILEEGELPVLVEIPAVGVKATVSNPNTTNIAALDRALLGGAVRYPESGLLGERGNVLLFGHSSYLPVVHNQAYKAFNDIQHLKEGDEIRVHSDNRVYIYAVEEVREENTATGEIPLRVDDAYLTLATCDTFGAKSDRFIVTAKFRGIDES